jgi:hypothetical protein
MLLDALQVQLPLITEMSGRVENIASGVASIMQASGLKTSHLTQ